MRARRVDFDVAQERQRDRGLLEAAFAGETINLGFAQAPERLIASTSEIASV